MANPGEGCRGEVGIHIRRRPSDITDGLRFLYERISGGDLLSHG